MHRPRPHYYTQPPTHSYEMLTDEGYLGLHADHAHITTLSLLPRAVLRGPKQKKLTRKQFSILSGSENLNFELRTAGIIQINRPL